MPNQIDKFLGIHEAALKVRGQRTELLASNLANADTPNYKARDIDFKTVLSEQVSGQGEGLTATHSRHFSQNDVGGATGEPMYRTPTQPSVDGNTVDTQVEKAAYMENALRYQASLTFIDGRIKSLMTAIRGE